MILFIVNPISGSASAKRKSVIDRIDKFELSHSTIRTQYAGHARELAVKAVEDGVDMVVAVGGDGTVNEVASALVGSDTALGIVPLGSGNGLANHLGINLQNAFDIIRNGEKKSIDVGTVNGRYFFCTTGVGYDAEVAMDYAKSGHRGLVTYTRTALRDWWSYKPKRYKLDIDGNVEETDALLITIGNANQWGNNFYITPQASLTDGILDITIVNPASDIQAVQMPFQLLGRSIESNSHVETRRGKKISISSDELSVGHYDGEIFECEGSVKAEAGESLLKVMKAYK